MNRLISSKYTLFFIAGAFFAGCLFGSSKLFNAYVLLPIFALVCFLIFMNRKNKARLIYPLLLAVMLLGASEYNMAASRQSMLTQFSGGMAALEGVVGSELTATDYGYKLLLKDVYFTHKGKNYKTNERLQLYVSKEEQLSFGDKIRVEALLEPVAKARNFGDFDFLRYYQSKGIFVKAYSKEISRLADNKGGLLTTLLFNCKQKIKSTIYAAMPETEAALLYGILTGSKSDIDASVKQVFSLTGLAHILSVSGLHVGFLVLMLTYLLKPLKLNKQAHSIAVFAVALFYILLIGAPPPAVRALLMLAIMLGGTVLGRKYSLVASASLAALLLLVYNPLLLHDPSFIISFACIYSIGFLHQSVNSRLHMLPSWLRSNLALSLAVWIGITPVLIYYFNYVSIINILLNVLAVPIAFLITLAGFGGVAIGIILPFASAYVFAASYYLIKLLYFISEKALLLPFSGLNAPSLSWLAIAFYYMAVLLIIEDFWKSRSIYFKRCYAAAAAVLLLIMILSGLPSSTLRMHFIDVGQGDCSIIRTPDNKVIVIDGGGSPEWQKSSYDIGKELTVPAMLKLGIWRVDAVIVSHIHEDHLAGVLSILEAYKVKQVILPASDSYNQGEFASENYERLLALCKVRKIPISYLSGGSIIAAGKDVRLKVLWPEKPYINNTTSDVNNNSLVFMLSYRDFDAIFTGDIQREAEQRLMKEELQCDLLKVAHHGSPYSTMQGFVEHADPEISVISVGKNNYGHPSKEVIERLKAVKSQVYRTDMSGAVMLTTNGHSLKIRTVR